jgi:hypothetical protein
MFLFDVVPADCSEGFSKRRTFFAISVGNFHERFNSGSRAIVSSTIVNSAHVYMSSDTFFALP